MSSINVNHSINNYYSPLETVFKNAIKKSPTLIQYYLDSIKSEIKMEPIQKFLAEVSESPQIKELAKWYEKESAKNQKENRSRFSRNTFTSKGFLNSLCSIFNHYNKNTQNHLFCKNVLHLIFNGAVIEICVDLKSYHNKEPIEPEKKEIELKENGPTVDELKLTAWKYDLLEIFKYVLDAHIPHMVNNSEKLAEGIKLLLKNEQTDVAILSKLGEIGKQKGIANYRSAIYNAMDYLVDVIFPLLQFDSFYQSKVEANISAQIAQLLKAEKITLANAISQNYSNLRQINGQNNPSDVPSNTSPAANDPYLASLINDDDPIKQIHYQTCELLEEYKKLSTDRQKKDFIYGKLNTVFQFPEILSKGGLDSLIQENDAFLYLKSLEDTLAPALALKINSCLASRGPVLGNYVRNIFKNYLLLIKEYHKLVKSEETKNSNVQEVPKLEPIQVLTQDSFSLLKEYKNITDAIKKVDFLRTALYEILIFPHVLIDDELIKKDNQKDARTFFNTYNFVLKPAIRETLTECLNKKSEAEPSVMSLLKVYYLLLKEYRKLAVLPLKKFWVLRYDQKLNESTLRIASLYAEDEIFSSQLIESLYKYYLSGTTKKSLDLFFNNIVLLAFSDPKAGPKSEQLLQEVYLTTLKNALLAVESSGIDDVVHTIMGDSLKNEISNLEKN